MADKSGFLLKSRNPDILTSIANLSNDEVFTPPAFANQMLDTVAEAWAQANAGADIWADSAVTFLDPFTKSGVFLREITRRLSDGLEKEIPDVQKRIDHILTKQIYGVAITELTSLLARRSVYCSKRANSKHSIATELTTPEGNISFERNEHSWAGGKERVITIDDQGKEIETAVDGKCRFCGAKQKEYQRGPAAESHAYSLIHTDDLTQWVKNTFGDDMQFDVIIGNPPYQLGSDGGTRDIPIYQKFVMQGKALKPRLLSMVIPARWMAGGLGLSDFRDETLGDHTIREIHDFPDSKEVFPSVDIMGGVCFLLWDTSHSGDAAVTSYRGGNQKGPHRRKLNEFDIFVRDVDSAAILRKVLANEENSITELLSVDKEFGWTSNFRDFETEPFDASIPIYYVDAGTRKQGYISRGKITKSVNLIDRWKVMVPQAHGGTGIPNVVLGKPFVASAPSVCTQTYLFFAIDNEILAKNLLSYVSTKFFRFLVSLRKITQHANKSTYTWVPLQDFSKPWTDTELYAKYKLTDEEIAFIESMIRPMELAGE